MCEIIAIIIVLMLIIMMCYRKSGFKPNQSTIGPYIYYNYDTPFWNGNYNNVITENEPMDFNVVLYTDDNFKGWAVPMRKGKSVLFAEQYNPHIKTWHFKSMKIKPGTKLQFTVTSPLDGNEILLGGVNFISQTYSSVSNINTLFRSHSDIRTSTFGEIFDRSDPNRLYYIQELY